jgi:type VI secretion system protein ImpM
MSLALAGLAADAIGWHGKLPVAGDFVTRRLPSGFVDAWDGWLSSGLAALRQSDPDGWLEQYLASPAWRFVMTPQFLPGPLDGLTWAGVMIPSVDRVGRYYPLTLATRLQRLPDAQPEQAGLWSWLHRLEDLAVDAMQDDWSIEQLDTTLLRMGPPQAAAELTSLPGGSNPWSHFYAACVPASSATARGQSGGSCVWYSGSGLDATRLLVSQDLDDAVMALWRVTPVHTKP